MKWVGYTTLVLPHCPTHYWGVNHMHGSRMTSQAFKRPHTQCIMDDQTRKKDWDLGRTGGGNSPRKRLPFYNINQVLRTVSSGSIWFPAKLKINTMCVNNATSTYVYPPTSQIEFLISTRWQEVCLLDSIWSIAWSAKY